MSLKNSLRVGVVLVDARNLKKFLATRYDAKKVVLGSLYRKTKHKCLKFFARITSSLSYVSRPKNK